MVKITLRCSQLSIQDGIWQQQAAHLYAGTPDIEGSASRARENRGALFVLIESPYTHPAPAALCSELVRTLTDTYYGAVGSVTRGLRSALLAANAELIKHNLRTADDQRVFLGINCVVVREQDAFVGQMGPALICLAHHGVLTRYPESSAWLRSDSPGVLDVNREPPAGQRSEIEPGLSHLWLEPGDVLLLTSPALVRMAPTAELAQAVGAGSGEAICANLETLANGHDLSVLVVECSDAAQQTARPTPTANRRPTAAPAQSTPTPWDEDTPARVASPTTSRREAPEETLRRVEAPVSRRTAAAPEGDAKRAETREEPAALTEERLDGLRQSAQEARKRTEDWLMRVLPESVPERPPERETKSQRTSSPSRLPQKETARPRSTSRQSQKTGPVETAHPVAVSGRALVTLALVIPLVMLALVILIRVRYERTRSAQFETFRVQAQAAYTTALNQADVASMRQGLYDALALTEDGLSVDPDDETLSSLARRIQYKLNDIDVVEPLYHFWKLIDLQDLNTSDAARVIVHDSDLFVLNRGSDRVYHYQLNDVGDALSPADGDAVLVQKGETRGGVVLGDLVDIAWLEAGGQRTLDTFVALERGGTLLAYDTQLGIDALPVADSDIWLKPQAIASYYGNLYVLDPLLGRILKYAPTDNAYTNPPGDYLANELATDLTGAVDMVVDGNLYVLFADGTIKKFLQGEVVTFNMASLPSSMRSPMAMCVSGEKDPEATGYVYVADTGNNRIVQFDKQGNYVRQFCNQSGETQLDQVRGLYVDEANSRIFFVSGSTLWLADLPSLTGN